MHWFRRHLRANWGLSLAALVAMAQFGAITHALQHDIDTTHTKVCTTCIASHSTGSGCVTEPSELRIESADACLQSYRAWIPTASQIPVARQRSPPLSS